MARLMTVVILVAQTAILVTADTPSFIVARTPGNKEGGPWYLVAPSPSVGGFIELKPASHWIKEDLFKWWKPSIGKARNIYNIHYYKPGTGTRAGSSTEGMVMHVAEGGGQVISPKMYTPKQAFRLPIWGVLPFVGNTEALEARFSGGKGMTAGGEEFAIKPAGKDKKESGWFEACRNEKKTGTFLRYVTEDAENEDCTFVNLYFRRNALPVRSGEHEAYSLKSRPVKEKLFPVKIEEEDDEEDEDDEDDSEDEEAIQQDILKRFGFPNLSYGTAIPQMRRLVTNIRNQERNGRARFSGTELQNIYKKSISSQREALMEGIDYQDEPEDKDEDGPHHGEDVPQSEKLFQEFFPIKAENGLDVDDEDDIMVNQYNNRDKTSFIKLLRRETEDKVEEEPIVPASKPRRGRPPKKALNEKRHFDDLLPEDPPVKSTVNPRRSNRERALTEKGYHDFATRRENKRYNRGLDTGMDTIKIEYIDTPPEETLVRRPSKHKLLIDDDPRDEMNPLVFDLGLTKQVKRDPVEGRIQDIPEGPQDVNIAAEQPEITNPTGRRIGDPPFPRDWIARAFSFPLPVTDFEKQQLREATAHSNAMRNIFRDGKAERDLARNPLTENDKNTILDGFMDITRNRGLTLLSKLPRERLELERDSTSEGKDPR